MGFNLGGVKFFDAIKGKSKWTGVSNVVSGGTFVVVSANQISSGQANLLGLGVTTVASHRDIGLSVNSIVENTSFMIVTDKATVDTQQVVYTLIRN